MIDAELTEATNAADVESSPRYLNCNETDAEKPDHPLPLSTPNLRNGSKNSFIENAQKLEKGPEVILVLLGVGGFNASVEGLRA